jgi:lipoyl-dependent peroxiredoxin
MSILYTAKTFTTGGRNGQARSDDHRLDIALSAPGSNGAGTNPEQLFAAGWSACFIGAMTRAAKDFGIAMPADVSVAAEVDLGSDAEQGYFLSARLNVSLPGIETTAAQAIVDRAHQLCPYSKAIRGNIDAVVTAV